MIPGSRLGLLQNSTALCLPGAAVFFWPSKQLQRRSSGVCRGWSSPIICGDRYGNAIVVTPSSCEPGTGGNDTMGSCEAGTGGNDTMGTETTPPGEKAGSASASGSYRSIGQVDDPRGHERQHNRKRHTTPGARGGRCGDGLRLASTAIATAAADVHAFVAGRTGGASIPAANAC
jgi:hypothetical protein